MTTYMDNGTASWLVRHTEVKTSMPLKTYTSRGSLSPNCYCRFVVRELLQAKKNTSRNTFKWLSRRCRLSVGGSSKECTVLRA